MKTDLLMLMLCSGFIHLTLATHRLRFFEKLGMESDQSNWTQSSRQCGNINASLITLYDEDDVNFMGEFTGKLKNGKIDYNTVHTILLWLGLSHKSLHGSGGGSVSQCGTVDEPGDKLNCMAIQNNAKLSFNCMEQKFFMCNTSKESTLVNINKTWCQALQHCRQHYNTNLANFSSTAQMEHNHTFWIGERYDNWQWHDNGCSSFRRWASTEEKAGDGRGSCGCTDFSLDGQLGPLGLFKRQCQSFEKTFCSTGTVRIKVINDSKTWEDAYDYCKAHHTRLLWIRDQNDQKAVEQWLNHTDTGSDHEFWIGLRQSLVFGFWIWSSDTTVWYENWRDDKIPEQPNSHHCGIIDKQDMEWRDEECTRERPFLCEEDIVYLD